MVGHTVESTRGMRFYVAAHSMAEAARLISRAAHDVDDRIRVHEIRDYYSEIWGDKMQGIEVSTPCVYVSTYRNEPPKRIL